MSGIERCLAEIGAIRAVAAGQAVPYGDRWERAWHQLLGEIDILEKQLRGRRTSR